MSLEPREYGAVFTRRWIVDLMLDTCGYSPDRDLAACVAVEPSCGDGAFLIPMVERLCASLKARGRSLADARHALRAFDLQEEHVRTCREAVARLLVDQGYPSSDSTQVADGWVRAADYLLTDHPQDADFVIGNPPYIRSEDMPLALRAAYLARCETMTAGSDVFVGFIERGLKILKPQGVLSFICADRWMHNSYGRRLRRLVADHFAVEVMYELHGVDAFAAEVSAYPAIIQLRNRPQGPVRFAVARPSFDAACALQLESWSRAELPVPLQTGDFNAAVLPGWFRTDGVWPSASPKRLALLETLNETFDPLEDPATGTKIGIGIATGADKVFIVHDATLIEADRLLPLVTTKHLRNGAVAWNDTWLANPWTEDGALVDISEYPRMAAYLGTFEAELKRRHTAQKNAANGWFRTIDKVHPGLAEKPKLLLQDMKARITPILDEGHYPHHNLYWVTSDDWDLSVLGGLLLSRIAQMFVAAYGVRMRGDTLRFQAQYLRLVRVPNPNTIDPGLKRRLAAAFQTRNADDATEAALATYGLSELPD